MRREFIRQLRQRIDPQAVSKLLPLLQDPDSEVRREAAEALQLYGWKPASEREQAQHAVALGRFDEVLALGAAAVDPLCALLKDREARLRLAALEMLIQVGGGAALRSMPEALHDDDPAVRLVAVQAVALSGGPEAVGLLAGALPDADCEMRRAVVDALERSEHPDVAGVMIGLLADPMPELRRRAAIWLGRRADAAAVPKLARALLDGDAGVRAAAGQALDALQPDWRRSDAISVVIAELETTCRTGSALNRVAAREGLKQLGRAPRSVPGELSARHLAAVMALAGAMQAPNRDLRQAAVEALGQLGDPRAMAALTGALRDPDEWVRRAAVYSLHALDWQPANLPLLAQQAVNLHRWDVACACGDPAIAPLLLALETSADPTVQIAAIRCLAQLGTRSAAPLVKWLQSGSEAVRRAAAEALSMLGWRATDPALAVRQAILLGQWDEAARHGASSVEWLVQSVKESPPGSAAAAAAAQALAAIEDPHAAPALFERTRDGQVAEAAVQALRRTLERHAAQLEANLLRALGQLCNVFQFQYAFDPRYNATVRTAMQEVDTLPICELAQRELARRAKGLHSPDA